MVSPVVQSCFVLVCICRCLGHTLAGHIGSVRQLINVQVLQELDERVQRMNEEHRRDARRRAEELVQPLLAPDFFAQ